MTNRKNNFREKIILSKWRATIFLLTFIFVSSCTSVQYGFDARENSQFSSFDNLGIAKKDFIKQYGLPSNKGLYQETPSKKVEKLYYTERIRSFLVTTKFVFENDILIQMVKVETRNSLDDILKQIEVNR